MPCPPSVPISVIPPVSQGVGPLVWANGSQVARLTVPLNPSWLIYDGSVTRWGDGSSQAPVLLPALQEVSAGLIQFNVGTLANGQLAKTAGVPVTIANNLAGGAAGEVVYQTGLNQTGFTAVGSSAQLLQSNGAGAPTWIGANNLAVTATGSTTARTLANRFADVVNVKDFGAVGDGVTDDTAAIQAAFTQATALGKSCIYFPKGNYSVSSVISITISGGVSIIGDGRNVSNITQTSTTSDTFSITPSSNVTISGLTFIGSLSATAGTFINFPSGQSKITIQDIQTFNGYNVISFSGPSSSQEVFIDNCNFVSFLKNGIVFNNTFGGLVTLTDIFIDCTNANTGNGILFLSGDTYLLTNVNIQGVFSPFVISPVTGNIVSDFYAVNCLADGASINGPTGAYSSSAGWTFTTANGGIIERVSLSNCWSGSMYASGFLFNGVNELMISDCIALYNAKNGFEFSIGCNTLTMQGCIAAGNSQLSSNTYSGINIAYPGLQRFLITNCISGISPEFTTPIQQYGINVQTGSSANYSITNNLLDGNVSGGLFDGGTGITKNITGNLNVNNAVLVVASASTINITLASIVKITGTVGISTISGPAWTGRQVTLITVAGAITFSTGGNIINSLTSVSNVPVLATFDGANWYLK